MRPEAMNAAMRVHNPSVINPPVTSSITPAHQTGQLPVGTVKSIGQPNACDVPKRGDRNPNTTRHRLRTAGEEELRRAVKPVRPPTDLETLEAGGRAPPASP